MSLVAPARHSGIQKLADRTVLRHKGAILAHLIGFAVFFAIFGQLLLKTGAGAEIFARLRDEWFTSPTDIPIRFVAVWLFLDRFGRVGRYRLTAWDALYGMLLVAYGLSFIFADLAMMRLSGGAVFVDWIAVFSTPLLFFIVVQEASLRKGYRPDILLGWLVGTAALAGALGLVQALDIAGMRERSAIFFNWAYNDRMLQGPSEVYQGRGPFQHANGLAVMMVFSFALVPACFRFPKLKPLAIPLLLLLGAATFGTYSRIGIVSAAAVFGSVIVFLLLKKRTIQAAAALCGAILLGFAFVASIYVFDIQRFKIFIEGEGTVARAKADEIGGWYLRQDANKAAIDKALDYPMSGVGATGAGINRLDMITSNSYSYRALTTNSYTFAWVSYGIAGLLFVMGQVIVLGYVGLSKRIHAAYALSFTMLAAAIAVAAAAENSSFSTSLMSFANVFIAMFALPALRKQDIRQKLPVPAAPLEA
ncbi:MAG: O-antigen ligase family protein [Fimbriimonadaceae bacterium]|nr:O-antigen ligase family protein [Chthonomonadaceae bacterium]MCO5297688.1 O-antigen ligase family protein [Fimbriimonadaceae bacterium]